MRYRGVRSPALTWAQFQQDVGRRVRYQLFDLASDPGEKKDLSGDKELLAQQRKHYDRRPPRS